MSAYERFVTKVDGRDKGKIFIFALSTCIWCRKTKELLKTLEVKYRYIDVDLVEGEEAQKDIMSEMQRFNPATSFPTIVFNDGEKVILGFEEEQIKECIK
jgi:glutaredoxin-like protein NrdH